MITHWTRLYRWSDLQEFENGIMTLFWPGSELYAPRHRNVTYPHSSRSTVDLHRPPPSESELPELSPFHHHLTAKGFSTLACDVFTFPRFGSV